MVTVRNFRSQVCWSVVLTGSGFGFSGCHILHNESAYSEDRHKKPVFGLNQYLQLSSYIFWVHNLYDVAISFYKASPFFKSKQWNQEIKWNQKQFQAVFHFGTEFNCSYCTAMIWSTEKDFTHGSYTNAISRLI